MIKRTTVVRAMSAATFVAAAVACGGTSLSDVLAGAAIVDAGGAQDVIVPSDGATSDGASSDAALDVAKLDAPPPKDAVADISKRIDLMCPAVGQTSCDLRTEVCCRTFQGFDCVLQKAQCQGLRITCAQQSDCEFRAPGTVCCGSVNQQSQVEQTSCEKPDNCVTPERVIICNPNDPDPCPIEGTCKESQGTLVGYYLCL